MRFLCLCSGGNIRSVHTAYLLKHTRHGHEALTAGIHTASRETLDMLSEWADRILICGNNLTSGVSDKYQGKVIQLGIGEDVWGVPSMAPSLLQLADQELRKVGF